MFDPLTDEMKDQIKQAVAIGNRLPFIHDLLAFHHQKASLDTLEVKRYTEKCQRDKLREFGPIRENELKSMLECVQIANNHAQSPLPWFLRYATNAKGNVRAIFWMSPDQVALYDRYHDIIVHDTTQSTNKFNMAMHNFVVVDSAFRTRLVASALTSGEKIQDCRWVLQQLLAATGGVPPGGIMLDKDLAMETACEKVLPNTDVYNCIWHAGRNRFQQLHKALGVRWLAFESELMTTARSLTPSEFDHSWANLISSFGDNIKVRGYLTKIHEDRVRWAWPWVRTSFTAGMQSTQRVEKTNHLLKLFDLNSNASLSAVFDATVSKTHAEKLFVSKHTVDVAGKYAFILATERGLENSIVRNMFTRIIVENSIKLGEYAQFKMWREMARSFAYDISLSTLDQLKTYYGTEEKEKVNFFPLFFS
jgi:hypothetical protein